MAEPWKVLVVDDEEDIHRITNLVLKRSVWRERSFSLTSCYTAKEAQAMLQNYDEHQFHVALVDVVMESDHAGLELCKWIRANLPRTLRIVLRTGQAGIAPEEKVLNDYDIDFYLSKEEVNERLLYSVIRSCLRSAQDIGTLVALGGQLRSLTTALRDVASVDELLGVMRNTLQFLEHKHGVRFAFVSDINRPAKNAYISVTLRSMGSPLDAQRALDALGKAHEQKLSVDSVHAGNLVGLQPTQLVLPTRVTGSHAERGIWARLTTWFRAREKYDMSSAVLGGLIVDMPADKIAGRQYDDLVHDLRLFMENWQLVYGILLAQENIARLRSLDAEAFWQIQQRDGGRGEVGSNP